MIADIPYNIGNFAYGSNPSWYIGGDNKNGESEKANSSFFDTDENFRVPEFFHFCQNMLIKEPKETGKAGCMIVFCEFEQQFTLMKLAKDAGFKGCINLVFRKNFSAQVLKANMRIVGNCEYGLLIYRDKLPKFNNDGKMVFNCLDVERDTKTPKLHPTQKSVPLLEKLIRLLTDPGDVVIDPVAGSGTSLIAAINCKRNSFGFEIKKDFHSKASELITERVAIANDTITHGHSTRGLSLWQS